MKQILPVFLLTILFTACGKKEDPVAKIASLKKERADIDVKIRDLETKNGIKDSIKSVPVSVLELHHAPFVAYIDVQAAITGDENVLATPQMPGTVSRVLIHVGQKVSRGQTLVTLNSAMVDQQIASLDANLTLLKELYEKQKTLWNQNIGTQVQLMQAKASYEAAVKSRAAVVAQRDMYRVSSPISGTVDLVDIKEGDAAQPGGQHGVRIVNAAKLKAEANLGESYLGKVHPGNPVILVFPDANDSLKGHLDYVAEAVDPTSRAFKVQMNLGSNNKLHPNMSAQMRIANYSSSNALVVPVSAVQKTGSGNVVFVANGPTARAVKVETGMSSDGNIEILSGLKDGDKVVVAGYEDLDEGTNIKVQ